VTFRTQENFCTEHL
jgi:hypothetical protein